MNDLDSSLPDHKATVKKLRDDAIKSIASIIPHHCGDHSNCGADCKYKIIETKYIDEYSVEPPGKLISDECFCQKSYSVLYQHKSAGNEGLDHNKEGDRVKIAELYEVQIKSDYAKKARFGCKVMSMGKTGGRKYIRRSVRD